MIQSVLLIARIASRPIQLGRRCAPAGQSAAVRWSAQALALLTQDADLATALAPTASVTPRMPANAHLPHLVG
jgi:hypothetical protein